MVCIRCKMIVRSELENLGIYKAMISLGEAKIKEEISAGQRKKLSIALNKSGFELLDEQKSILIEKIKNCIVELVHYSDEQLKNFPAYLSKKLNHDYALLDSLFLEVQNITIELFLLKQKIERVKELLVYNKLNLSEIAYQLNFKSASQMSVQFKNVTGFSPSHFQQIKNLRSIVKKEV